MSEPKGWLRVDPVAASAALPDGNATKDLALSSVVGVGAEPRPRLDYFKCGTKADVEAACRLDAKGERDFLAYALHNIQGAIAKREDAPCSSAEHAKAAQVALQLERVPTYTEVVAQWQREAEGGVGAEPRPQEPEEDSGTFRSLDPAVAEAALLLENTVCECAHIESVHSFVYPDSNEVHNCEEDCDCQRFRPVQFFVARAGAVPPERPQARYEEAYFELIYAVGMKHPNETRHQTALRYIRQAEEPSDVAMQEVAAPPDVSVSRQLQEKKEETASRVDGKCDVPPTGSTAQSATSCAPANAEPFVDTPLKQAIRRAFDHPSLANIEAVAALGVRS